ncbi:hypothetical protein [Aliidiomarina celeris]|nr:hypothetical protein [Aliidiomarina celeris]
MRAPEPQSLTPKPFVVAAPFRMPAEVPEPGQPEFMSLGGILN